MGLHKTTCHFFTLLLLLALFAANSAHSQNRFSVSSKTSRSVGGMGRDFWFGIPQNNDPTQPWSKVNYYLYITASKTTVVTIDDPVLGLIKNQLIANKTLMLSSEAGQISNSGLLSSGIIENKTFHIWSDDADLSVEFLSKATQSTDGMSCVPTSGWGKEYVVASYNSYPSVQINFPSEFIIIASEDSTVVEITPSDSIRKNGLPLSNDHAKGETFSITLKRGELVQFQSKVTAGKPTDLTGTYISSNKPVGVIGASACPSIQEGDIACDHILDMMQPMRCWGNEYLTGPFAGRKYGGDLFLLVTSKDNQTISRNGAAAFTGNKHDHIFTEVSEPSHWTSNEPFMLVQYMQSATHAAPMPSQRNPGDPAMSVVDAVNQYNTSVQFSIPTLYAPAFSNYINILVPVSHESSTTIDGKLLTSPPSGFRLGATIDLSGTPGRHPISGTQWEVVTLQSLSSAGYGSHIIQSDTLIEAYIYGLSTDESYAMPAHLGSRTSLSTDTTAPFITDFSQGCSSAMVMFSDGKPIGLGLSEITVDSTNNMTVSIGPSLKLGDDSTFIVYTLIDSSKAGYASTTLSDIAGNSRIVEITAVSDTARIAFSDSQSKVVKDGTLDTIMVFIHNTSNSSVELTDIFLEQNTDKFKLLTGTSMSIASGTDGEVLIAITLTEASSLATILHFTEGCHRYEIDLSAEKGSESFTVTNCDFGCIPIGTSKLDSIRITNLSTTQTIQIDSIWISAPTMFQYSGPALPIALSPEQSKYAMVQFAPILIADMTATISFRSTSGKVQTATMHGCTLQSGVDEQPMLPGFSIQPVIPNPVKGDVPLTFGFSLSKPSVVSIELLDQLGNKAAILLSDAHYPAGTFSEHLSLPLGLSTGTYYYRYSINGEHKSGKLIIAK